MVSVRQITISNNVIFSPKVWVVLRNLGKNILNVSYGTKPEICIFEPKTKKF